MNRALGASNLTWQISYAQYGQTNVVFGPVSGVTNGTFTVPANATGGGNYIITLTAMDNSGNVGSVSSTLNAANPPAGWTAYYPLTSNANDANGNFNGTLEGGASFVNDPQRGNVLVLNGNNQFVSLPAGLAGMKTFMAWVKWNGGPAWQRIYDFGNDTNRYTVLTPYNSDTGTFRFNISIDSRPGEQIVDAPAGFADQRLDPRRRGPEWDPSGAIYQRRSSRHQSVRQSAPHGSQRHQLLFWQKPVACRSLFQR